MEFSCNLHVFVRFRGFVSLFLKEAGTGSAFCKMDRLSEELNHIDSGAQGDRCDA